MDCKSRRENPAPEGKDVVVRKIDSSVQKPKAPEGHDTVRPAAMDNFYFGLPEAQ
jgi:hypothetical protein